MEQEEETLRMESWGSGRAVERKGGGVSRTMSTSQKSGGLGHHISTRDSRGCGRGPYREGRSCWAGWEAALRRQDLTWAPRQRFLSRDHFLPTAPGGSQQRARQRGAGVERPALWW